MIKDVNIEEMNNIIHTSPNLVLVEFYLSSSAGSYLVELSLKTILTKYINGLDVYKINVDKNLQLQNDYSLISFPSLLFFKNNKLIDILKGVTPKSVINKKINSLLNNNEQVNSIEEQQNLAKCN